MEYIKVKDHPDLVRDKASNAILNVNDEALNKYREERARLLKMKTAVDDVDNLKKEVENLKQGQDEIKELLQQLLKR